MDFTDVPDEKQATASAEEADPTAPLRDDKQRDKDKQKKTYIFGQALGHSGDVSGGVDVDAEGAGGFGQAGHEHHAAGDDDQEAGTGGEDDVGDVEGPAGGRAELLRVVGEGVLGFGDADGEVAVSPGGEAG